MRTWLTEAVVQLDMTLSGRSRDEAAAMVAARQRAADLHRQALAVRRETEKTRAVAVRAAKQQQAVAVREAERHTARLQEHARRQKAAQLAAFEERCREEAWARAVAMQAAQDEAFRIVDNLGFTSSWVEGSSWFPDKSGQEERQKYRAQLVERFTDKMMANANNQHVAVSQQNAWGDANFAQGVHVQQAFSGRSSGDAGSLSFKD